MVFPRIAADSREATSGIPDLLKRKGAYVQIRTLTVGDYVTGRIAIERKTARDFISSLYRGRLFDQAKRLANAYTSHGFIIEGDFNDILSDLKSPKIYWGALASLAYDFGSQVFFTLDHEQTADLLVILSKKTGTNMESRAGPLIVKKPKMANARDWQLSIVESLPAIGPRLAEQLLRNFGSVRSIVKASRVELVVKGGIGMGRAAKVQQILDLEYGTNGSRQTELV